MKQESIASKPREQVAVLLDATKQLVNSGITEKVIKKEEKWIHFSLPDHKGDLVNSQDLLVNGPLVVCFYRGVW